MDGLWRFIGGGTPNKHVKNHQSDTKNPFGIFVHKNSGNFLWTGGMMWIQQVVFDAQNSTNDRQFLSTQNST